MKKVFFWIFFVLAFLVLGYDMCFAVFGAIDVRSAFDKLAATPEASGIDYWGVGADIFVIFVIAFSILGLILSIISRIISYNRVTKILSYVILACFSLPVLLSHLIIF